MSIFNFIKSRSIIAITLSVVMSFAFVAVAVNGATTISTNVSTGGTLSVTGASTLTGLTSMIQASSTRLSVFDTAYFGGSATSTFDSSGNLSVIGTLGVTGVSTLTGRTDMIQASSTRLSVFDTAYFGGSATSTFDSSGNLSVIGTLGVTGVSTLTGRTDMIQASSTRLSVFDTAYFGGSATSTFSSTGALTLITDLTLQNAETISNSTDGTITLGATNMVLVGTASTSAIKVGDEPSATTINGLVSGYCTFPAANITASSTTMFACAGATGLQASDRVFVQATSSLPANFIIQHASTTADGIIQVDIFNTGYLNGVGVGTVTSGINSLNFWAFR